MDKSQLEIVYLGFLLPALFCLTLVAEGLYKISRHEEGFFPFVLGILFLLALLLSYMLVFNR